MGYARPVLALSWLPGNQPTLNSSFFVPFRQSWFGWSKTSPQVKLSVLLTFTPCAADINLVEAVGITVEGKLYCVDQCINLVEAVAINFSLVIVCHCFPCHDYFSSSQTWSSLTPYGQYPVYTNPMSCTMDSSNKYITAVNGREVRVH